MRGINLLNHNYEIHPWPPMILVRLLSNLLFFQKGCGGAFTPTTGLNTGKYILQMGINRDVDLGMPPESRLA